MKSHTDTFQWLYQANQLSVFIFLKFSDSFFPNNASQWLFPIKQSYTVRCFSWWNVTYFKILQNGPRKHITLVIKTKVHSDLAVQTSYRSVLDLDFPSFPSCETMRLLSLLRLIRILHNVGTKNAIYDAITVWWNCNLRLQFYQGNSQIVVI